MFKNTETLKAYKSLRYLKIKTFKISFKNHQKPLFTKTFIKDIEY